MDNSLQKIISFYRDCYQFEYSTEKISNFYSSTVTNLYYPNTFKLLSQNEYELPISTEWGEKVTKELELESSEKKLVCGSFFLKGNIELLGKNHRLFTPLFLNDVILKCHDEVYYLVVDQDSISLNPIAVNYLNSMDGNAIHSYDDLSTELLDHSNLFSFSGLVMLQDFFKEKYPTLKAQLLEERIATNDRISELDTIYNSRKNNHKKTIFPDILIGLTEKPKKSKDVINELTDLSTRTHGNTSILSNIFKIKNTESKPKNKKLKNHEIIVPVSLSQSQEKILKSTDQSNVSVVIGPPGTGKSFSIAVLAIQAFQEGKKVLIASKNEQACQVLFNKIEQDIGIKGITINSSKARYKITVSTKLRNIANGIGISFQGVGIAHLNSVKREVGNEVSRLKKKIKGIINEITSREQIEKEWGRKLTNTNKGLFFKIQEKWIEYRHSLNEPIWQLKYELHKYDRRLKEREKELIELTYQDNLDDLLTDNRSEILQYGKAFKETRGNVIKEIFSATDFNIVLEALPIWICRSIDVANIVPHEEGIFDLLIIDEASLCDISSSIPLIYRANSIAIVGDPNQLKHISFIYKRREELTRMKYGLNHLDLAYRDRSILDLVNDSVESQDNIIFLDEHFRSMPDIIHFSNNQFYSGQLKIMTDHLKEIEHDNLKIRYIKDGERNAKGENYDEANHIIDSIQEIVNLEGKLSANNCSTIGIISPFTNQAQLIKKLVKEKIESGNIAKHKILIGTPFKFQGEERDIIFLSFTVDADTHQAAIRYLERPDVFNVSITRARSTQEVYISLEPKKLKQDSLLYKYLNSKHQSEIKIKENHIYDQFLDEVIQALEKIHTGKILINKKICGTQIDIVLVQEKRTLGIDLVGFPGEYTRQLNMHEITSLERAKIDIFLLPYSTWHFDKELCLTALSEFLII